MILLPRSKTKYWKTRQNHAIGLELLQGASDGEISNEALVVSLMRAPQESKPTSSICPLRKVVCINFHLQRVTMPNSNKATEAQNPPLLFQEMSQTPQEVAQRPVTMTEPLPRNTTRTMPTINEISTRKAVCGLSIARLQRVITKVQGLTKKGIKGSFQSH